MNEEIFIFRYRTGEEMRRGDRVAISLEGPAVVEELLVPGSPLAAKYYVEDTGGSLLRYDSGQVEVWTKVEDELALLGRGA